MTKESLTPEMFECLKEYEEIRKRNPIKLFNKIATHVKNKGHEYLAQQGFNDVQMWCGAVLGNLDKEGTNINTLAQRANMSKQAISKLVKELSVKKYVTLTTDDTDKRAVKVMFTLKGIQLLMQMGRYSNDIAQQLKDLLGEDRYISLTNDLVTIDQQMKIN